MRTGDLVATVARPALSGTLRARQTKKETRTITARQWMGYVAVAATTTWLTRKLDDLIDRRYGTHRVRP
jgi:hypothetical protein